MTDVDRAYRKGGFRAVNLAFLRNLKRSAAKEYASPLQMAEVAAGAGDKKEAITWRRHLSSAIRNSSTCSTVQTWIPCIPTRVIGPS